MDVVHTFRHSVEPFLPVLGFLLACAAGSVIGVLLLFRVLAYLQQRRDSYVLFVILSRLKRPLYFLIPVLVVAILTPELKLTGPLVLLSSFVQAALIVLFAWMVLELVWVVEDILDHRCSQHMERDRAKTLKTQMKFVSRILVIIIVVVMIAAFLMTFENAKRLGMGLLTSAGIFSVVLGFAAQKTLGSVLAGFQVAFNRMLRIGDGVRIENESGQVEEITLTHVVLRLLDNRRFIIPINYFMEKPYQNWTLTSSEHIGEVSLSVDYSVDLKALRDELDVILRDQPLWDGVLKTLQVTDMTDKCMIVRILLSSNSTEAVSNLCCAVREQLIAFLCHHAPNTLPRMRTETKTFKD